MGGKNFWSDYHDCVKQIKVSDMRLQSYLVDFLYQLYRIMIGIKNKSRKNGTEIHEYIDSKLVNPDSSKSINELILFEDSVAHLIATCSFVKTCTEKEIFPIPVFDGHAPDIKKKKLEERRRNKNKANEECSKITDKRSAEYIKQHKKTVDLHNSHFDEIMKLMDAMGLPYVQAPGEADSQCAAMAISLKNIAGIIAEDSDILIFGGTKLIKNFKGRFDQLEAFELKDIFESLLKKTNKILTDNDRKPIEEFTIEYFVDYRIIQGTDYNDAITGLDSNKLFELFVLNDFNVVKLLEDLKNTNCIIPIDFEKRWIDARNYYLEAQVRDPECLQLEMKKPNLDKLIEILHKKNKFKISFVKEMYENLLRIYSLYCNITNSSNFSKSFQSYQTRRFHNRRCKTYEPDKNIIGSSNLGITV